MTTTYINIGGTLIDASTVTPPDKIWREAWVWNDPDIELDHDLMKPIAHKIVEANYNAMHAVLCTNYTAEELHTWTKQEAEARAHQLDTGALTPFIDQYVVNNQSLAGADDAARKATLCDIIENNADAFEEGFAEILSTSKELKMTIEATADAAALEALDLSISDPNIVLEDKFA